MESGAPFVNLLIVPCVRDRIWILLRFKERLVQMAMSRSAAAHATSPGSSIVRRPHASLLVILI